MNIRLALLKEHSKENTVRITHYIGNDQSRFDELISLFLGNEYRVTQRSAWVVSTCLENHPGLIDKHIQAFIENLGNPVHDAVKRNTVRVLQFIEIPEKLSGICVDHCFRLLQSPEEPIAVKVFSMSVIANLCKKEPGLKNELRLIIEQQLPYSSAGFKSRAKKVLRDIDSL